MTRMEKTKQFQQFLRSVPRSENIYQWKAAQSFELIPWKPEDGRWNLRWFEHCHQFTCHSTHRCMTCQSRTSGLGNPKVHQMTIQSQLERGTFNMLQPEVQINKVSNSNLQCEAKTLFCNVCKTETKHLVWEKSKQCCVCKAKNNGVKFMYCEQCGKTTKHNGTVCCECYPDALPELGMHVHLEYCNTCGRLSPFVKNQCMNCKPLPNYELFKPSMLQHGKDMYAWDNMSKRYVMWDILKVRIIQRSDLSVNPLKNLGFVCVPTFRTQESNDWTGVKTLFEHYLAEKGVGWFVYVKFYVGKDKTSKPLVVGKSGSILVNSSGSDVSFSMNVSHGPSRRFLLENDLQWDKTKILLLQAKSEQEALQVENMILSLYGLFSS